MVGIGGTPDRGSIAWYARLSEHQPTLEIRVADAQLHHRSSVLLAILCKGLVATHLDAEHGLPPEPSDEFLDAALWHAARYGLGDRLVHPLRATLVPAAEAVACLLETLTPALTHHGELEAATSLLKQLQARGSGAEQQRASYGSGGRAALGALIAGSLLEGSAGAWTATTRGP